MRIAFLDDACQKKPSRDQMGSLVGIGGLVLAGDSVSIAGRGIEKVCGGYKFPKCERFKWSPGGDHWMRKNLVEDARREFFVTVLDVLQKAGAEAFVVIADSDHKPATGEGVAPEIDVATLALERVHKLLDRRKEDGIVIVDRPGGGKADEEKFLLECLETIQSGTDFVVPARISINVVAANSKFVRLLQAADVVTSCTVALVAGERTHAPPVFESIKKLLAVHNGRIGGMGLKIHPDFRYANLYHWRVGDKDIYKAPNEQALPMSTYPYPSSADSYHGKVSLIQALRKSIIG
jgi:hypothetical protein